jgi:hypothetical protein
MAKVDKLITYAYLKEELDIPIQVEESEFEHPIYRAQETLRMLMGDEFYQDYITNYKSSSLSAVYTTLYEYIKKFVAWQTYEYWTFRANFKITRSGFRVHQDDNTVPASDMQMANLIKDAKQQAQYYKVQLVDYLNGHYSDYPLYSQSCNGNNLTGNTFKISVARSKNKHGVDCHCRSCRS